MPEHVSKEARAYLATLHERFHPRWTEFLEALNLPSERWHSDPGLEALVAITIDSGGRALGVWLVHGSGAPKFDLRATQVVLESTPFPPPPATMRSDDGFARIVWRFGRGPRPCSPMGAVLFREKWEISRLLPLLATQRRYEDARVRIDEALRTGEAGPEVARAYARALLWAFLHDPDRELRTVAAFGLAPTGDPEAHEVVRQLLLAEPAVAARAVRALAKMAEAEDAEELLRVVGRNDGLASVEAVPVLARLGRAHDVVRVLEPRVLGTDALARGRALKALLRLDSSKAVPLFVKVAEDRDQPREARLGAIEALGRTRDEDAARTLNRLLREPDEQVRAAALVSLARTGRLRVRARTVARDWLRDQSPTARAAAATALVFVGDGPAEWRGRLVENLKYADQAVALAAVEALRAVKGPDALRALAALKEEHGRAEVRLRAREAYAALAGETGEKRPDGDKGAPAARTEPRGRDELVAALGSADLGVACAAAQRLAALGLDVESARRVVVRLNSGSPMTMATLASAILAGARFECPRPQTTSQGAPGGRVAQR